MSAHFHPLRIRKINRETDDCVSVSFEVPDHLQDEFSYTQGQSLTMRTNIREQEVRRTYSICSSPLDGELKVAIKRIDGGLFSEFAFHQLKAGDVLEVMQPVGRFNTKLDPANSKNYLAFAAGSGITPVLSLIKTTLATEPFSSFTLVYGNRSRNSIIFFEELEGLKNRYIRRFNLVHVLSRERTDTLLNFGRIGLEKLDELGALIDYDSIDEFFLCGPENMIFGVRDFLVDRSIDVSKIHFELFTTPVGRENNKGKAGTMNKSGIISDAGDQPNPDGSAIAADGSIRQKPDVTHDSSLSEAVTNITVRIDGRSIEFQLARDSDISILDAAMQQGADLPFACKGGVCCTCRAKLVEGKVDMDVCWGLEPEEIAQGFILTCQGHPRSDKLVIDFDIK